MFEKVVERVAEASKVVQECVKVTKGDIILGFLGVSSGFLVINSSSRG